MGNAVKAIWALFGDVRIEGMSNFHNDFKQSMTKLLKSQESELVKKDYSLAIPKEYMTQKGFWNLVAEPCTYGIIWFSHAYQYQDSGITAPAGWDEKPILMKDVHGVSKNLQFAAILGCKLYEYQYEWAKTLNLIRFKDYKKRMVVYDMYLPAIAEERGNRWQQSIDTIRKFLKEKSHSLSMIYNYPTWVEMLPKV